MTIVNNTPTWEEIQRTWESTQTTTSGYPWSTPHTYDQRDTQIAMMQSQLTDLLRRLTEAERGLTSDKFNGTHDADLVLELIARGYVVHKPLNEEE